VRVHGVERPEVSIEEFRYKLAEKTVIARKTHLCERDATRRKRACKHLELRALAGAVNPFEND
jgi:hypothetical protein